MNSSTEDGTPRGLCIYFNDESRAWGNTEDRNIEGIVSVQELNMNIIRQILKHQLYGMEEKGVPCLNRLRLKSISILVMKNMPRSFKNCAKENIIRRKTKKHILRFKKY